MIEQQQLQLLIRDVVDENAERTEDLHAFLGNLGERGEKFERWRLLQRRTQWAEKEIFLHVEGAALPTKLPDLCC